MNADAIKTLTTDALDKLAALLDEGHSERLTALLLGGHPKPAINGQLKTGHFE